VHYRRFEWLEGCVGDAGPGGNPERNLIWHSLITRMVKTIGRNGMTALPISFSHLTLDATVHA
jgi:hypothetical protein